MNRLPPQYEAGATALAQLVSQGEISTGTDLKNALYAFATFAASIAPAQDHEKAAPRKGIDFAAEADFYRAIAAHFNAVAAEYDLVAASLSTP